MVVLADKGIFVPAPVVPGDCRESAVGTSRRYSAFQQGRASSKDEMEMKTNADYLFHQDASL